MKALYLVSSCTTCLFMWCVRFVHFPLSYIMFTSYVYSHYLTHTISLYTFTAPTDAAFAALDEDTLAALSADTDLLTSVLLGHVVNGAVKSSDLSNGQMVTTLNEEMPIEVEFGTDGSIVLMGVGSNANVVPLFDVMACNGVIHTIDTVLLPSSGGCPDDPGSIVNVAVAQTPGEFNTLVQLVTDAGLVDYLNDLDNESTVFGE